MLLSYRKVSMIKLTTISTCWWNSMSVVEADEAGSLDKVSATVRPFPGK